MSATTEARARLNTGLHAAQALRPVLRDQADEDGAITLTDRQLAHLVGRSDRYVRYGLDHMIRIEGELRSVLHPSRMRRRTLYLVVKP